MRYFLPNGFVTILHLGITYFPRLVSPHRSKVCGLPGSGKSSFCHELVSKGSKESLLGATWTHICYDDVERALRVDETTFNPETWQEARAKSLGS